MKRYAKYKDSGVEWIGDIPEGWGRVPLKFFAESLNGFSFQSDDFDNDKEIPVIRIGDISEEIDFKKSVKVDNSFLNSKKEFIIKRNDILIGLTGATIGKSGRYNYDFPSLLNQRVGLLRNNNSITNGMLYYFIKSYLFKNYIFFNCYGGGQDNISMNDILNMVFPLPPLKEQEKIVEYLDEKTSYIDKLLDISKRKIGLLKEQRASIINQVVTKGLNPNAKMKNSGVEWIGDIPEGWGVLQIKYISKILRGKFTHRPRNDERFYNGRYPFIQTGDIVSSGKYLTKHTQTLNELGLLVSKEFPIGTLVMTISGNIGDVSILKIRSCFPDSILGFFSLSVTNEEYLYYLFSALKLEFLKNSTVSTQMNLNVERVGSIQVPLPTIEEQTIIIEYLDNKTMEIDKSISIEERRIGLLKEYRQSIISQVVTGKIKVTADE